jgi:hypothetical protein
VRSVTKNFMEQMQRQGHTPASVKQEGKAVRVWKGLRLRCSGQKWDTTLSLDAID